MMPRGYDRLVFEDNFDSPNLEVDREKWAITYDGNPDSTYETYADVAFKYPSTHMRITEGHSLELKVTKEGNEYHTCSITTQKLWTHGYWECRFKKPQGNTNGIGANFWTNSKGWVFPEIDIWEWSGTNPDQYKGNFHNGSEWVSSNVLHGLEQEWNTAAMDWNKNRIILYLNDKEQKTIGTDGWEGCPQWVLLGATVGPFGDKVDDSTAFPAVCLFDYVRIWQK